MATRKDSTNPDPLGRATDRVIALIVALLPPDRAEVGAELGKALGDLFAELINRSAVQSASTVVHLHSRIEDVERRDRARDERIRALAHRVDAQIDALWREQPVDQSVATYHNAVKIEALEKAVKALKEKQAGGDEG
jgi:hypothetical protein